jgi:hypothetical protein
VGLSSTIIRTIVGVAWGGPPTAVLGLTYTSADFPLSSTSPASSSSFPRTPHWVHTAAVVKRKVIVRITRTIYNLFFPQYLQRNIN